MIEGKLSITVVIPTFNRRDLITRALESVFAQTYRPIEVVVVDDCSTDYTVEFLEGERFPEQVKIVRLPENVGPAGARNAGIDAATGEYVAFLDSDDWWLPEKLAKQVSMLHSMSDPERSVFYTKAFLIRKNEIVERPISSMKGEGISEYIFCNGGHVNSSSIMLATTLARTIRYDNTLRLHEDWEFYIRLEKAGAKFVMLHEPLTATHDAPASGRASNPNPEMSMDWLNKLRHEMPERAYLAFRAKVAPQLRLTRPISALAFIIKAFGKGAIGPSSTLALLGRLVHPQLRELAYLLRGRMASQPTLSSSSARHRSDPFRYELPDSYEEAAEGREGNEK